jgi:nicotinate-nucleotide adenylyltransferase
MRHETLKIGILGGTFDPIHNGHLAIAQASLDACQLDEVIFVPAGNPWMKSGSPISSSFHRLAMTENAIQSEEKFVVSRIEIDRPGPSYMVETLEQIQNEKEKTLYLIIGADAVEKFSEWKNPNKILSLSRLIIASRPQYEFSKLDLVIGNNKNHQITILSTIKINISASEIRKNVFLRKPINNMVPKNVEDYIKLNNLYTQKVCK